MEKDCSAIVDAQFPEIDAHAKVDVDILILPCCQRDYAFETLSFIVDVTNVITVVVVLL